MRKRTLPVMFALSISVMMSSAQAAVPINSVNDGRIINGGIYYNTADNKTTFINSHSGGLWLKAGTSVSGHEATANGNPTLNGGTLQLYAPGAVVRIDGTIDVNGTKFPGNGYYTGNGGKVLIDAAYLFQSGNIYANGYNAGLIQMNVGAATFNPNANVQAQSSGGNGGIIAINASGPVDIKSQAKFNSSGQVFSPIDTNVINIEGGLINIEGRLTADGIFSRGGTIRLVSTGNSDLSRAQAGIQDAQLAGTFTALEKAAALTRLNTLKSAYDGDIHIASGQVPYQGWLNANGEYILSPGQANDPSDKGSRNGDGGTLLATARRNILNEGWIYVNGYDGGITSGIAPIRGGNGGTINLNAGGRVLNTGRIVADGGNGDYNLYTSETRKGGDAGLVAFSYHDTLTNQGVIRAIGGAGGGPLNSPTNQSQGNGGNGGLIFFAGPGDPLGTGVDIAIGGIGSASGKAGIIASPNPSVNTNQIVGIWDKTRPDEVLSHAENLLFLNGTFDEQVPSNLNNWLSRGNFRSILDPKGKTGEAWNEIVEKSHIVSISNPAYQGVVDNSFLSYGATPNPYLFRNMVISNTHDAPFDFLVSQNYSANRPYTLNVSGMNYTFTPTFTLAPMNTFTMLHYAGFNSVSDISINGGLGGGRVSVITPTGSLGIGNVKVAGGIGGGSMHGFALRGPNSENFALGAFNLQLGGSLSGGSIIMKTDGNMNLAGSPALPNVTNGGLIGGTQQYLSDINIKIGQPLQANGQIQGGILFAKAQNNITVQDRVTNLQVQGGQRDGYIKLDANNIIDVSP